MFDEARKSMRLREENKLSPIKTTGNETKAKTSKAVMSLT